MALQGEIARAIANEFQVGLTSDEEDRLTTTKQIDPEAQEEFFRGLHVQSRFRHAESIAHFRRAIEVDPSFVEARARLANVLIFLSQFMPPDKRAPVKVEIRSALDSALALNPDLSEAQRALGKFRYTFEWDWPEAEASLRRAVALSPNSADAHMSLGIFLIYMLRLEEGIENCESAHRLEPASLETNIWLAFAYAVADRWDDSIARIEFIRDLDPEWQPIHHCLSVAYAATDRWDNAVASCDRYPGPKDVEYCGSIYGQAGFRDKAVQRFEMCKSGSYIDPLCAAGIHSGLGEIDEAFDWLEAAYEERAPMMLAALRMPVIMDNLHGDPRFEDILRRMNLPVD